LRTGDGELPLAQLIFVGIGRSGSTLLGEILNHHPECLISNEVRYLERVIRGEPAEQVLRDVRAAALFQLEHGLEEHIKRRRSHIRNSQSRWVSFREFRGDPDFAKRPIRVIGDKKAGGATETYLKRPQAVLRFLSATPGMHCIQIVRDPVALGLSRMKHNPGEIDFAAACDHMIRHSHAGCQLAARAGIPYHRLYYEDLLRQPSAQIRGVLDWLGLGTADRWLEKIVTRIQPVSPQTHPSNYREIAQRLVEKHAAAEFGRYFQPELSS
jgi:hypothetical protein